MPSSVDAWQRVCRFEEWLYQTGVRAAQICAKRRGVDSLEQQVVYRATTLAQSTQQNSRLRLDGHELSFEEQRVMTFVMTAGRERTNSWLELRAGFRSIAKRRALIYATSFDFL